MHIQTMDVWGKRLKILVSLYIGTTPTIFNQVERQWPATAFTMKVFAFSLAIVFLFATVTAGPLETGIFEMLTKSKLDVHGFEGTY